MTRMLATSTVLTASQVNGYLVCPERYRLQYVVGARPSHRSSELVFGGAIRDALLRFHRARQHGGAPTTQELQGWFTQAFRREAAKRDVLWADDEGEEQLLQIGTSALAIYAAEDQATVLAVEHRFTLPFEPGGGPETPRPQLSGVIDLVERDPDGRIWVTKIKTASRRLDETCLRYDLQMSILSAARTNEGWPDARLRFRVIVKTDKPQVLTHEVRRDEASLREAGRIAEQVSRAISLGVFFPNRTRACLTCSYRSRCGEP